MAFVPPHAHIHKEKTKHVSYGSRHCSRLMAWTPQRQIEHIEVLDTVTGVTSGRVYQGKALGCMLVAHPLRSTFISIVEHGSFDRVVLFLILANSCFLSLTDYSKLDNRTGSPTYGEPTTEGSLSNQLVEWSDPVL